MFPYFYSFILLFFLSQNLLFSQTSPAFQIQFFDANSLNHKVLQKIVFPKNLSDTVAVSTFSETVLQNLQEEGYLSAQLDSLVFQEKTVKIYLNLGKKWFWEKPAIEGWQDQLLENLSKRSWKLLSKNRLNFAEKTEIEKDILQYWENRGYPFAQIRYENWQVGKQSLSADWRIEPQTFIRFDSIIWEGEKNLKSLFWQKYLRFQSNTPFSQQKVRLIERQLRQIPYFQLEKPVSVLFRYERAFPYIRLKKLKINEIDGIIGFLPNASATGNFAITGRANLKLYNLFGTGKYFRLDWQYPKTNSQTFRLEYMHPNLLNAHLDLQTKFSLLKEDSSFLNISRSVALRLDLAELGKIQFSAEWNNTTATDSLLRNQFSENPLANTEILLYGLAYSWQNLDNFLYPRKGWEVKMEWGIGNRTARRSTGTPLPPLQNVQWRVFGEISKFWALGKTATFLLKNQSGFLESKSLFINELYRLGGFSMLRGFNENIFYASRYSLNTAEIRLYFQENSAIGAFVDQGFLGYELEKQRFWDNPTGMGMLLSLGTKGGIFNFALAVGSSQFQQIGFSQAKVHFGFVNRF